VCKVDSTSQSKRSPERLGSNARPLFRIIPFRPRFVG
jgi:hypothetical protein